MDSTMNGSDKDKAKDVKDKAKEGGRTGEDNASDTKKKKIKEGVPSYLSYLDDDEESQQEEHQPQQQQQQPGAYSGAPGEDLRRRDEFSLVGAEGGEQEEETTASTTTNNNASASGTPNHHDNNNNLNNNIDLKRGVSNSQLAVARLVPVPSIPVLLEEAQEMNSEELERTKRQTLLLDNRKNKSKRKCIILLIIGSLLLLLIGVVVLIAVVLGTNILDNPSPTNEDGNTTTTPTIEPPSQSPSSFAPPKGSLNLLKESLPNYTLASLNRFDSPQWKAWDWLSNHPNISNLGEWRKKQLFALATFYYSFEGENWYKPIQQRWLDYGREECQWFSSGFGYFDDVGVYTDQQPQWKTMPCNGDGEFVSLHLENLQLSGFLNPKIPPEITLLADSLTTINMGWNDINASLTDILIMPSPQLAQMTKLTQIMLNDNNLPGPIPSQLGLMTSLTRLYLYKNSLHGSTIPSELGLMTNMIDLDFHSNGLNGRIPSQLGFMTGMTSLWLENNHLTGPLPSQLLGSMTSITSLNLLNNYLSGSIPTEVGRMVNTTSLWLRMNTLDGQLPTELGFMTSMTVLWLDQNHLSGSIPSQLALITSLEILRLEDNALHGTIPLEMESLARNGSLRALTFSRNSLLSGTIPEGLCSLGLFDDVIGAGLSFDCNDDKLCGCCWCPCPGTTSAYRDTTECQTKPFVPSRDATGWPGAFPTIPSDNNRTKNAITINLQSDGNPEDTSFKWSIQDKLGSWKTLLESSSGGRTRTIEPNTLHSYTVEVESDSIYRLQLFDDYADGTCCEFGLGWFTITTNSAPSNKDDHGANGTVIWEAAGYELEDYLEVILSIDPNGHITQIRGQRNHLL